MEKPKGVKKKKVPIIGKEVFVGLISIAVGCYNLLQDFDIINFDIEAPQIVGNALLVLGGIFLLVQAYKLFRHEWHIKSIM